MQRREALPEGLKREVRQRCGFGCVICGEIPYEYEHIVEFAQVRTHTADNITLLCKKHHGEKTLKFLPRERIQVANNEPFNLKKDRTGVRTLYLKPETITTTIGNNEIKFTPVGDNAKFVALKINETEIFSFEFRQDEIILNLLYFNEKNEKVIEIVENEITHSTKVWDAEWKGRQLTIRDESRSVLFKVRFSLENKIEALQGFFFCDSLVVYFDKYILMHSMGSTVLSGSKIHLQCNNATGIHFQGHHTENRSLEEIKNTFKQERKKFMRKAWV